MQQQQQSDRQLWQKKKDTALQQSSSNKILFKMLKYQAIVYAVLSILSIPLWVLSSMEFGKYASIYPNNITVVDYLLITTSAHLHHCYNGDQMSSYMTEQSNYTCIRPNQTYKVLTNTNKSINNTPANTKVNIKQNNNSYTNTNNRTNNNISNNSNKTHNTNNTKNNNTTNSGIVNNSNGNGNGKINNAGNNNKNNPNNNNNTKNNNNNNNNNSNNNNNINNKNLTINQSQTQGNGNSSDNGLTQEQNQIFVHSYLRNCLLYDSILQGFLCIGCAIVQYVSYKLKQKYKVNFIQNYSLQLYNLPKQDPYILLPKLQAFLIKQIKNQSSMVVKQQPQIFSMTSAISQQKYHQLSLRSEIKQRVSQGIGYTNTHSNKNKVFTKLKYKLETLQQKLKKFGYHDAEADTVWVTFQSRLTKYLAMRYMETADVMFMNRELKVRQAPHPLQIMWQNLHSKKIILIITNIMIIIVCMGILVIIDLLILYIQKNQKPIVANIAIFLIQIILKQIIVTISKWQKYKLKSKLDQSIFCNLIKYLYINTALIAFISNYDFGDYEIVKSFSTRQFKGIGYKWFHDASLFILLSFVTQITYVCARPFIQVLKIKVKQILMSQYKKFKKEDQFVIFQDKKQNQQLKLKSQLDVCYAYLVCVLMFGNTYTFTHPVMYTLLTIFVVAMYFSHKQYIIKYAQPAPYNTNILNTKAIQYIYFSVVVHWGFIYIIYQFLPALVLAGLGAFFLLIKNTFVKFIIRKLRKKFGLLVFSQFKGVSKNITPLRQLLTIEQINQHIQILQGRIVSSTFLYTHKNKQADFQQADQLQTYIHGIQQKIKQLQKIKYKKMQSNKANQYKSKKENQQQIQMKGSLSYNFTEQMHDI